jgi:flagellar basal body rod protein FlgC
VFVKRAVRSVGNCFLALVTASALLVSLTGCHDEAPREQPPVSATAPSPAGNSTAANNPPPSASAAGTPAAPALLRRSAQTNIADDSPAITFDGRTDIVSFRAIKTPAGTLVYAHSLIPADERIERIAPQLQALDFKPEGDAGAPSWTASVSGDGKPAFELRLGAELRNSAARIDTLLRRLRSQPGRVMWDRPETPAMSSGSAGLSPARLIYTGHPMDIAFSDSTAEPRWFVAVKTATGAQALLRGGRLFVAEDGTLEIERFALGGELPRVPRDTQQIVVDAGGQVSAIRQNGAAQELGRLPLVKLGKLADETLTVFKDGLLSADSARPLAAEAASAEQPVRAGHLEYPAPERATESRRLAAETALRSALESLSVAFENPTTPATPGEEPLVVYADLPWSERHLKALGVHVDRAAGRLVIDGDSQKVAAALPKVLQVLRLRMSIHEQNLRNAERVRDAENRLNPYRRKTLSIDDKGEVIEGEDPSPFPKTFKQGDPNADADGFITLPNVNRAVETAEFQAAREEYKLIRAAAERLEPRSIFPDPPQIPVKE